VALACPDAGHSVCYCTCGVQGVQGTIRTASRGPPVQCNPQHCLYMSTTVIYVSRHPTIQALRSVSKALTQLPHMHVPRRSRLWSSCSGAGQTTQGPRGGESSGGSGLAAPPQACEPGAEFLTSTTTAATTCRIQLGSLSSPSSKFLFQATTHQRRLRSLSSSSPSSKFLLRARLSRGPPR
jgi:hypothetical protein